MVVEAGNGNMFGLGTVTAIALAARWPILALLGWIFYRSARGEQPPEPAAGTADP